MNASDVLLAARDLIRERGWTQGTAQDDETGAICLEKAVAMACDMNRADYKAFFHLKMYCMLAYLAPSPHIVNDVDLTSEDEVCDLLEKAAKWNGGDDSHEGLRQF